MEWAPSIITNAVEKSITFLRNKAGPSGLAQQRLLRQILSKGTTIPSNILLEFDALSGSEFKDLEVSRV